MTNQSKGFKLTHCFTAHLSLPQLRIRMTNLPVNPSFRHLRNHFFFTASLPIVRKPACLHLQWNIKGVVLRRPLSSLDAFFLFFFLFLCFFWYLFCHYQWRVYRHLLYKARSNAITGHAIMRSQDKKWGLKQQEMGHIITKCSHKTGWGVWFWLLRKTKWNNSRTMQKRENFSICGQEYES